MPNSGCSTMLRYRQILFQRFDVAPIRSTAEALRSSSQQNSTTDLQREIREHLINCPICSEISRRHSNAKPSADYRRKTRAQRLGIDAA